MSTELIRQTAKYHRITELGRGGMATCYLSALAGPAGFQKLVVLKEMRHDLAEDPEFRRMFMAEARIAARLNHPNVVQTYEAFEADGVFAIVMEYLDGQPLNRVRKAVRREVILPLLLMIASQALAGLEHVHELGLVHRDVSPQNIFVTYAGDVKLLDFGIVKATDSSVHTAIGTLKGKLGYMAPEQVLGRRVDRRTDVFAMGVVLWEALTGTRLWANVAEPAILGRLASGEIPKVRSVKSDVPVELEDICARAMQVDPDLRYPTALEFQRALDAFIAKMTTTATRRDLAQLMNAVFSEQRQKVRVLIDASLSGMAQPSSGPLPGLATSASRFPSGSGFTVPATAVTSSRARVGPAASNRRTALGLAIGSALIATVVGIVIVASSPRRDVTAGASPVKTAPTIAPIAPTEPSTAMAAAPVSANASSLGVVATEAPATATATQVAPALATKGAGGLVSRPAHVVTPVAKGGATTSDPRAPAKRQPLGEPDLGY